MHGHTGNDAQQEQPMPAVTYGFQHFTTELVTV